MDLTEYERQTLIRTHKEYICDIMTNFLDNNRFDTFDLNEVLQVADALKEHVSRIRELHNA